MIRIPSLVALALVASLVACHRGGNAPAPASVDAGSTGATAEPMHAAGPSDGGITSGPPPRAEQQAPPPCTPHVDGSDGDHRLFPVDSVSRSTTKDGKTTLDILLLESTGACDFDRRKPATYRGMRIVITAPGEKLKADRYRVGSANGVETKVEFLSPGPKGTVATRAETGGFIDLQESTPAGAKAGFDLEDASGKTYGCFETKPCP